MFTWIGDARTFGFYAIGLLVIAVATVFFMPETKGKDLTEA